MIGLLVLLAAVSMACGGSGSGSGGSTSSAVSAHGDDVTLSGQVTAIYGRHLFAVGSGAERVVVVTATPIQVTVGRNVEVTGRVRTFSRAKLEAELAVQFGPHANRLEESSCLLATTARVL
ncbi:MAG: hypothetical protein ACRD1D_06365 [Acidimicrobiales bacterium]